MMTTVLLYARTRMKALGYAENPVPFSSDSVPKTKLDRTYTVKLGTARGISNNQATQVIETPFKIELYRAPSKDVQAPRDAGAAAIDQVVSDFISAKNRTAQVGLKNVIFNSADMDALSKTNDNGVLVTVQFTAQVLSSTF